MTRIHQPLHPDIIPRLDDEYARFHDSHLKFIVPPNVTPFSPSIRQQPAVPGSSMPLDVGSVRDISLPNCRARVFTPTGSTPPGGWPCFLFFHGGGWTLGSIDSENSFATNMCQRARCVVVSVDYRLAPENPYPAAVQDALDALDWVITQGKFEISINVDRIAVGGSSSGGNLAAVLCLKAASVPSPAHLVFQLLVVPVTDNMASTTNNDHLSWSENKHTPWLSPDRMMWFRGNYLPDSQDWVKWDASPLYAPIELLAKTPKAWIGVNELDILRDEGKAYGSKLSECGVEVEVQVYKGAPHPVMAMDGVLTIGKQLVSDAANALANAFEIVL